MDTAFKYYRCFSLLYFYNRRYSADHFNRTVFGGDFEHRKNIVLSEIPNVLDKHGPAGILYRNHTLCDQPEFFTGIAQLR